MDTQKDLPKEPNDIRIGMQSRVRNILSYCNNLISTTKPKFLKFSAVGGAIGKLVDVVEVLKCVNPGLYQTNKIATVSYQSVNDKKEIINQKLYPKFEVILSFEEPKEKSAENYQDKLPEEERKKLFEILNSRPQRPNTSSYGYRGGYRGGFRGGYNRGSGSGYRDGNRGYRSQQGGYSSYGSGYGGGYRRDGGSNFRSGNRGGFRGGNRGGYRGQRRDYI